MYGKPSFSRGSKRFLEYRRGSPLYAAKEIRRFLEAHQPVSAIRTGAQDNVVSLQGFKGVLDVSGSQIWDVRSLQEDAPCALAESFKKCGLHSLTKISGDLFREDQILPKPSPQRCRTPSVKARLEFDRAAAAGQPVRAQDLFCELALEIRGPGGAEKGNKTSLGSTGHRVTAENDESVALSHQGHSESKDSDLSRNR